MGRIVGMARRPFDPASHGWTKTTYQHGDILDRAAVDALVAESDVVSIWPSSSRDPTPSVLQAPDYGGPTQGRHTHDDVAVGASREAHMSGTTPDPAAGANPFGELAKFALAATERNMALARSWSDALLTTVKEQSEDARVTLTTLAASLEAMERALASQEETNRALRQSLEGYRQIVDRYATAQERTAGLVQSAVDDLQTAGEGQMEAARALLRPPTWATEATGATEPFTQMMQAWTDAFTRFSGGRTADPRSS